MTHDILFDPGDPTLGTSDLALTTQDEQRISLQELNLNFYEILSF